MGSFERERLNIYFIYNKCLHNIVREWQSQAIPNKCAQHFFRTSSKTYRNITQSKDHRRGEHPSIHKWGTKCYNNSMYCHFFKDAYASMKLTIKFLLNQI